MELYEVYDGRGTFSYQPRAGDGPGRIPIGDVEPMWRIHLYRPGDGAAGGHDIPHARLENTVIQHGIDADDIATILRVIMHWEHIPDPDDVLAWQDPGRAPILKAVADIPDPTRHLAMPAAEKAAATLARVDAVRAHVAVDPAPLADRAGAMAAKAFELAAADPVEPAELAYYDRTPHPDPLDPLLQVIRLDPARLLALRAQYDWMAQAAARPRRRSTMRMGPGQALLTPPPPAIPASVAAGERGAAALAAARARRTRPDDRTP